MPILVEIAKIQTNIRAQATLHKRVVCLCVFGCLAIPNKERTAARFFYFIIFLEVAEEAKYFVL